MQNRNNYTPDVLDCLANLSNDEVFTPPAVVNQMLDMLPQEVFMSKDTTFLDPFTKSGVFLREITKRLLENQIPDYKKTADEIEIITKEAIQNAVRSGSLDLDDNDYEDKARCIGDTVLKSHPDANKYLNFEIDLQAALDHILKNQVFGIAITELTAQLARRSLYCSKDATSKYSVANATFGTNADGNIRFEPMKHTWDKVNQNGIVQSGASCKYCGASASNLNRPDDLESHAYEFIHKDIADIKKEFGNMEFTVVCGNPPYQLNDGGGTGDSAKPIYNKFVEQAKRLNPKYLTMIIPSRWMSGGKGLDSFRDIMLNDDSISQIVDYFDSTACFPGVDISGGVCYFLRDRDYHGECNVINVLNGESINMSRPLLEDNAISFIRFNQSVSIFRKVQALNEDSFVDIVSSRKPFGISTNVDVFSDTPLKDKPICMYAYSKNRYVSESDIIINKDSVSKYKVFVAKAYGERGNFPYLVIGKPFIGKPETCSSETYLKIGDFDNQAEADNVISYMHTKFFRFLVLLQKNTQNAARGVYRYVPIQDFSKPWTDAELYAKYNLTQDEIDFIESMVKPME